MRAHWPTRLSATGLSRVERSQPPPPAPRPLPFFLPWHPGLSPRHPFSLPSPHFCSHLLPNFSSPPPIIPSPSPSLSFLLRCPFSQSSLPTPLLTSPIHESPSPNPESDGDGRERPGCGGELECVRVRACARVRVSCCRSSFCSIRSTHAQHTRTALWEQSERAPHPASLTPHPSVNQSN